MPLVSAFDLGLLPMFSAAVIVELAALWVPRWRPLPTAGPVGRERLTRASYRLGLVLAFTQALAVALYLQRVQAFEGEAALSRALAVSTLMAATCFLLLITWFLDAKGLGGGFGVLFTAFALSRVWPLFEAVPRLAIEALDVASEASAVRRRGELVPVWPEHRLYAVDAALTALGRQGIPAVARRVYQRALWQFFAPLIPIQIMVPPDRGTRRARSPRSHLKEDRP